MRKTLNFIKQIAWEMIPIVFLLQGTDTLLENFNNYSTIYGANFSFGNWLICVAITVILMTVIKYYFTKVYPKIK